MESKGAARVTQPVGKGLIEGEDWQGGHKTISETHGGERELTPQSCPLPCTHTRTQLANSCSKSN